MDNSRRPEDIEMEGRPCAGYSNGGYRADDLERIREELNTALRTAPEPAAPVAPPAPAAPRGPRVAAICIRNAKKSYPLGSGVVLDGFNMTVAEGSIYSLLGASGCGKTTVLSCVVGRRRLNEGTITVLGLAPGTPRSGMPGPTIGYMPQELALYGGFTVTETLKYFGWVAGMSQEDIDERTAKLLSLLEIPTEYRLVRDLSGGQQRRVSLAVTLIHRPPIVILDEPTVGVDPVLRQNIWDLLLSMTRDGHTTVVITTHYIEEARQADTIGLMRNGTLLAEDRPDRLLERYACDTMEEVFLKLSLRQQRALAAPATETTTATVPVSVPVSAPDAAEMAVEGAAAELDQKDEPPVLEDARLLHCKPVHLTNHWNTLPCLWKNLTYMKRNVVPVLFVVILPIIQCGLFGVTVGRDPKDMRLAVVNDDVQCTYSSNLAGGVDYKGFPGYPSNCTTKTLRYLSCRMLSIIDDDRIALEPFPNIPSALEAVRAGKAWGALYFPANYSRFLAARHVWGRYASDKALNHSEISVWMDMSNQYIGYLLQASLSLAVLRFTRDIQEGCMWNTKATPVPVRIMDPVYGQLDPSFQDFCLPGMIVTTVFFMALLVTVGSILEEKRDGLMARSLSAGVTIHEVLAAHVLVQIVLMIIAMVTALVMLLCVFQLTNNGPLYWVVLLCFLQGLCGMCLGFFISCLCESDMAATYMGVGTFFPLIFLSGMVWPVEGMHSLLRSIGWALPLTQATTSLRSIMGRGWSIDQPAVYLGFVSTAVWIAIFVSITLITLRVQKRIS
ncbi:ABC transporter G family member 23-like [Thrips palmi]|uniref:ABC transporter G family member 23-like n=1 Tax=Thrips palmi TaxID=161013 RepID=A0A6P9AJM9_THRPL|nr:ABC transporter G family member 23-like [Thrips palmi]